MGELKPLGSEKLSGDAKLKRILELTYYQSDTPKTKSAEIVKESTTGVYGIVKEKDGYYVKKGLTEESLDYIGGLFMKNKNKFSSYAEAYKKLEFLTEQELVTEAKRYVLKRPESAAPAPQAEAPMPAPTNDVPPAPAPAPEGGVPPMDSETPPEPEGLKDMGGEEAPDEYLKIIQKMTGRLTQKLSTYKDKLESQDLKYVLKMVIAAIDIDKMDASDVEEILAEFEDDEEGISEPTSEFPTDDNGETPAPQETNELDGIASLDELINTPFEDDYDNSVGFDDDDLDFLNSPDIRSSKATKFAEKDIENEFSGMDDEEEEIPLYTGDDDEEIDPESPLSAETDFEDEELDENPISDIGQMPNLDGSDIGEEEDSVKELDINELTDMVNSSVKETLSKYFS